MWISSTFEAASADNIKVFKRTSFIRNWTLCDKLRVSEKLNYILDWCWKTKYIVSLPRSSSAASKVKSIPVWIEISLVIRSPRSLSISNINKWNIRWVFLWIKESFMFLLSWYFSFNFDGKIELITQTNKSFLSNLQNFSSSMKTMNDPLNTWLHFTF